jgi:uncharacterized membrane protein (UPF0127 family)
LRPVAIALLVVGAIAVVIGVVVVVLAEPAHDGGSMGGRAGAALRALVRDAAPADAPFAGLDAVDLAVGGRCLRVVVADEVAERVQGLRARDDLGGYDGMLFVYDEPTTGTFTMSTVRVALDIGFYESSGAPVSRRQMTPCPRAEKDCPSYSAGSSYQYALETLSDALPPGELSPCS